VKKEFDKRDVYKHLGLAVAVVITLVLGTFYVFFPLFTHHGESMTVPNLEGFQHEDLEEYLGERDLRFEVEPDSGFSSKYPPLAVLKQFPLPGSKVKENRKIYLTLNAVKPPVVKMPSLKGRSLKNAQLELRSLGLALGDITYKPDFALNTVLEQYYQSKRIREGQDIPKGSEVDFEVGDGLGNQTFQMLDLKELELEEAVFVLRGYGLKLGEVFYKERGSISEENGEISQIKKSVGAGKIFKQVPMANSQTNIGQTVDLWLVQVDSTKVGVEISKLGLVNED